MSSVCRYDPGSSYLALQVEGVVGFVDQSEFWGSVDCSSMD